MTQWAHFWNNIFIQINRVRNCNLQVAGLSFQLCKKKVSALYLKTEIWTTRQQLAAVLQIATRAGLRTHQRACRTYPPWTPEQDQYVTRQSLDNYPSWSFFMRCWCLPVNSGVIPEKSTARIRQQLDVFHQRNLRKHHVEGPRDEYGGAKL